MATVYITVGLPASGKTTWAEEKVRHAPRTLNTNRDELRFMMYGTYFGDPIDENEVTTVQHGMISSALKKDKDVIVSDTNLNKRFVKQIVKIAEKWGAKVEFVYFDVPVEELVQRDFKRALANKRAVGRDVIEGMAKRYGIKSHGVLPRFDFTTVTHDVKVHEWTDGLPFAVVCDIDATIAEKCDRSPYDYSRVIEDLPIKNVIDSIILDRNNGFKLIFMSGRKDECYEDTKSWIDEHVGGEYELYMRKADDDRMDAIVKNELFEEHVAGRFNIHHCWDDREQVIEMYRRKGITVYDVAGNKF